MTKPWLDYGHNTSNFLKSRRHILTRSRERGLARLAQSAIFGCMSNAAKDHKEEFLKYLELHDKAEDANDSLEVARFALQAVNEIHLVMPGRNDRAGAIYIIRGIFDGILTQEQIGELYDKLRQDAKLMPAI